MMARTRGARRPRAAPTDVGGGMPVFRLALDGDGAAVRRALDMAKDWLALRRVSDDVRDRVMIVLAEALNNVVEHALATDPGGRIDLTLRDAGRDVTMDIVDDGRAMPGLEPPRHAPRCVDQPRDTLPEGGFGWNLIHDIARDVRYRRAGRLNLLHLRIPGTPAS